MSEFTDILNTALNEKRDTKAEAVGVNVGWLRHELFEAEDRYIVMVLDKNGRKKYVTYADTDEGNNQFIIYVD